MPGPLEHTPFTTEAATAVRGRLPEDIAGALTALEAGAAHAFTTIQGLLSHFSWRKNPDQERPNHGVMQSSYSIECLRTTYTVGKERGSNHVQYFISIKEPHQKEESRYDIPALVGRHLFGALQKTAGCTLRATPTTEF